jgi:hypothetical protein
VVATALKSINPQLLPPGKPIISKQGIELAKTPGKK